MILVLVARASTLAVSRAGCAAIASDSGETDLGKPLAMRAIETRLQVRRSENARTSDDTEEDQLSRATPLRKLPWPLLLHLLAHLDKCNYFV
jgi:hypothetical protein